MLFAVTNGNLTVLGSRLLFVVFGGGYSVVVLFRHFSRLRQGLVAQPTTVVVVKSLAVLVVGAAATFLFTLNRSPNPDLTTIRGVPYVVPIILVLLAVGTFGLATAINYARSGMIDWIVAAEFIGGGVVGGALGMLLATRLAGHKSALTRIFAALVFSVAAYILYRSGHALLLS